MRFFGTALVAACSIAGSAAAPSASPAEVVDKRSTPNGQGTNNGYFWQFCMFDLPSFVTLPRN
jgi:hypothetical protein